MAGGKGKAWFESFSFFFFAAPLPTKLPSSRLLRVNGVNCTFLRLTVNAGMCGWVAKRKPRRAIRYPSCLSVRWLQVVTTKSARSRSLDLSFALQHMDARPFATTRRPRQRQHRSVDAVDLENLKAAADGDAPLITAAAAVRTPRAYVPPYRASLSLSPVTYCHTGAPPSLFPPSTAIHTSSLSAAPHVTTVARGPDLVHGPRGLCLRIAAVPGAPLPVPEYRRPAPTPRFHRSRARTAAAVLPHVHSSPLGSLSRSPVTWVLKILRLKLKCIITYAKVTIIKKKRRSIFVTFVVYKWTDYGNPCFPLSTVIFPSAPNLRLLKKPDSRVI